MDEGVILVSGRMVMVLVDDDAAVFGADVDADAAVASMTVMMLSAVVMVVVVVMMAASAC